MIKLFFCGDVMTGRGIDQILPYPSEPEIYEPYVKNAIEYFKIAEEKSGAIPKPVDFSYIWGDALLHLERYSPDLRLINLETSITTSKDYWRDKGINYRMNPKNTPCLTTAKIDCCAIANNHVLDWGYSGLTETLGALKSAGIKTSGAGKNLKEAQSPAVMKVEGEGRIIFFSFGSPTSGVPPDWAASESRAGVNFLDGLDNAQVDCIARMVREVKRQNDVVVLSIHWGSNWGYDVPSQQRLFAHRLIEQAGVDLIHGHSSHHPKGIEVYKNKLVIYGCGDFLNDYEGIGGYEHFRSDLGLMYFASLNPNSGQLCCLQMVPTQIKHFKVNNAQQGDAQWLSRRLNRECEKFGCAIELNDSFLELKWS